MKKHAFPQRLADMEHILASELADHLDDYLDRCSAENIGFIVDTDKKSYVLCPARWFDYSYDDDFGVIVNAALRYAIGRHSYLPSTVARSFDVSTPEAFYDYMVMMQPEWIAQENSNS